MTKPDLMAELADKWDAMAADARKKGEHGMSNAYEDCAEELRTHHAELEAVVRDGRRLDWLETMANKPGGLLLHDGSESGRCGIGLRPGACDRDLRAAIDQAMHNSAREG